MKDYARHFPGSTRSRRTPLPSSFPFFLPSLSNPVWSEKSVQNPYKSDHFCKVQFLKYSPSTTYDFNALKCTDFPHSQLCVPNSALKKEIQGNGPISAWFAGALPQLSCSLGEKVGMRNKLVKSSRQQLKLDTTV